MNRLFARTVSATLVATTTALSLPLPATAGIVGTEQAIRADALAGIAFDRATLHGMLEREDVRAQLQSYGVDAAQARARIDALTDEEVAALAQRVGTLPAGADFGTVLGLALAVVVILLITDLLGLTRVFPFMRSTR